MSTVNLTDAKARLPFLFEPERLPADVVERIADGRNRVWFSILSLWEIAIKQALRRDEFDSALENVHALAVETGFVRLDLAPTHSFRWLGLSSIHRDPFDRILVAQCLTDRLRLLTTDGALPAYSPLVKVV